ncbi:MAG: N-6 DNA methylase [Thermoanaerobaculia bacterium]
MLDKHYTPLEIATQMILAARDVEGRIIADFAAGGGQLLASASGHWPGSKIVANDVDGNAIRGLRRLSLGWMLHQIDFLNTASRARLQDRYRERIGLIVLNPPFSCRGGHVIGSAIGGVEVLCSTAMAFLLGSLPFLAPEGEIVAVVPRGSLSSEKDARAWALLQTTYEVTRLRDYGRTTFRNCAVASTTIVIRRLSAPLLRAVEDQEHDRPTVSITRGSVPVHAVSEHLGEGRKMPFVHTTALREHVVRPVHRRVGETSSMSGPAVLLPRVGRPDLRKVATLHSSRNVVLSDCVFALHFDSDEEAHQAVSTIVAAWSLFESAYSGTCAPYLTMSRLEGVLARVFPAKSDIRIAVSAAS